MSSLTYSAVIYAPLVSKIVAGTHEGHPKWNLSGDYFPFSIM